MRILIAVAALALVLTMDASAQVTGPPTQQGRRPQPSDTIPVPQFRVRPPVSPLGAAARSLVLPGWGQSILGRRATGVAFIVWEGVTLTMTVKSVRQLHYQEATGAETVPDKRQEVEDWAVLLGFNHLVAAAEAFVAAQLWDFPGDLSFQALPGGSVGMVLSLRF